MKDAKTGERSKRFLWRCRDCEKQYTVRIGTILNDSRIPLTCWCYAFWAACASKKGVSAKQIQRQTGLSYKSALFMMHRIRMAMAPARTAGDLFTGTVEVDETYVGGKPRYRGSVTNPINKRGRGTKKIPVLAVVERGGSVRAEVVERVNAENLRKMILKNVAQGATVMTDDLGAYKPAIAGHGLHEVVQHGKREYVNRDNPKIHTNTVEGFFALIKRGMYGTYHAVSRKHLHRYVDEFAFRYDTRRVDDGERVRMAIQRSIGRRLLYEDQRKPVPLPLDAA